jgi:hypothetical protein
MIDLKEIIKNGDVIGLMTSKMSIDFYVIYEKDIFEISFLKNSNRVKIKKFGENRNGKNF